MYLRSPASAGALYPIELYFCASGLGWLNDGLWHYAPEANAPRRLRPAAWPGRRPGFWAGSRGD